jgi:hypothetical protein
MATPTADKLKIHFPSRYLTSDNDPLPELTASSGTLDTITDTSLTDPDGYWDGALGWFEGDTLTPALQGQFFHVKSYDSLSHTLLLSRELPAAPTTNDTYRLVIGGRRRSSHETFGMLAGGVLPELKPVSGVNISGLTIKKASGLLQEGMLTVEYTESLQILRIRMGSQPLGVGLDVSTSVTDAVIFTEDGQAFIQVDVIAANLPTSDQADTWTLSYPERTFTPDYEGYETQNGIGGKTRYRLECLTNADPVDPMVDLTVYTGKPVGAETAISTGQSLDLEEGSFDVDDAMDWPTRGFWIRNKTVNSGDGDCRYVNFRSGNTLYCLAVEWAMLAFDGGTNQISQGDEITDASSGATAIVDQVLVEGGDWSTNNAVGMLLLKRVSGVFGDDHLLQVSSITMAVANGEDVPGLRGYVGMNWSDGDAIELMPDIDIGMDKPPLNLYKDPSSVTIAPDDVDFMTVSDKDSAIDLGNLAPGKLQGVWRREWIMDGHQSRSGIIGDTRYSWS